MKKNRRLALLSAVALASVAVGATTDGSDSLRVRALGCFFEVPASYTLIADPGDRIEFIAPLASGSISIGPFSPALAEGLSQLTTRTEGHLTIVDLTDHDAREPLRITIIHNRVQAVLLNRSARDLTNKIVAACLANIHPRARGAPTKSP